MVRCFSRRRAYRVSTGLAALCLMPALLFGAGGAGADASDVGLVLRLKGEVIYSPATSDIKGEPSPAQSFMKIRRGDRFELKDGAELLMVYFASGVKERWQGPAVLRADLEKSEQLDEAKSSAPEITTLPVDVAREVQRISPLIAEAGFHRKAAITVRGGPGDGAKADGALFSPELDAKDREDIQKAKERYNRMVEISPPDDVIPEIWLISVLSDYEQFNDIEALINTMRRKQPDNPAVGIFSEWLDTHRE